MSKRYFVIAALAALMPMPFVVAAKKSTNPFKPSVIRVQKAKQNSAWSNSQQEINKKLGEAVALIQPLELRVGDEDISYTEKRVVAVDGKVSVSEQRFKDREREIALVLLNEKTGKLDLVKIVKHGGQLINPSGYVIEVVERMNGVRWNVWATQYKVVSPKNTVVLLNKYPDQEPSGAITYRTYSPYSPDLAKLPSLKEGAQYLNNVVEQARADLRTRGVMSRAIPDKLAADVLPADYFKHLPFLEQSDLLEALWDSDYSINRVLGTLGFNKSSAWALSVNYAGANGWIQFTDNWRRGSPGTYTTIARLYPQAGIDPDFKRGAADHINSMKAAILLYDNNLMLLINVFGRDILNNPRLEEFLAASYNGPPSRVIKSLNASGSSATASASTWIEHLVAETEGYIAKLRILNQNQIPNKYLE